MDKIVLYVEEGPSADRAVRAALALARKLGARLFAVYVLDSTDKPMRPGRGRRSGDAEEKAWRMLYEIEDDAFEQEISVSLLLEQGRPIDRVLEVCRSYDAGLLVVAPDTRLGSADVLANSPIPVVFAAGPKEA